jgi:hypothetical protein
MVSSQQSKSLLPVRDARRYDYLALKATKNKS